MLLNNLSKSAIPADYRFAVFSERPFEMLAKCPAYKPTPLRKIVQPDIANSGLLIVKDETRRMGLGSFKALGGAFAVAQVIAEQAKGAGFETDEFRKVAASLTFITASAGNHGLSVAAGARIFGSSSVIILSRFVSSSFVERIRQAGGKIQFVDGDYDDSVAYAKRVAEDHGWFLLADGSWHGYVRPPALVMEGYTVIAEECRQSFQRTGDWPTHIFLQAGVGGLAGSFAAHVRTFWPNQPKIIVVEPDAAPCLLESMRADRPVRVEGPVSNMGRLDCKECSLIAFEALRHDADCFVTISDDQASQAVGWFRRNGIETTPSGAAGMAALLDFELPANATCLVLATEGAV